jgi:gluconokinase
MVIAVMGAAGSGPANLGRQLAETLGWEFFDATQVSMAKAPCEPGAASHDSAGPAQMEALSAALRYWNYQWRDVVIACSISEQQETQLGSKYPWLKFVHLVNADKSESIPHCSQKEEQLVAEVISALIFNRRRSHAVAA